MKKTEYRQIYWGIMLVAIVFAAPFVLPWAGKILGKAYLVIAQSSDVSLLHIDPPTTVAGSSMTLYGSGFTPGNNTIHFGNDTISNASSTDGTTITFTVPSTLPNSTVPLPAGEYPVFVSNANGESDPLAITIICNSNDCSGGQGTYTGPINLCSGFYNCIEGFKVPIGGVADAQSVIVDNQYVATSTSFAFDQIPTGLHTMTVTVPTDWYSGFTLCVNNIRCHTDLPIQGNSVTINFLSSSTALPSLSNGVVSVPDRSYIDIYWHFSQNFADFGGDPGGFGPPTGGGGTTTVSSSTPYSITGPQQAAAYTAGNTNGGGLSGVGSLDGLAAAAQNVLGCSTSQILNPAIRAVIARDQAVFQAPQPKRSGGGGVASIIVDARGDTAALNYTQLPYITGNTTQAAIDARVNRASSVGVGNNPAWDAVAYCLQNSMLKYINQSAVTWMNTAFNGNPAFVQNLTTFLTGISDQQAVAFFQQLRGMNSNSPIQPWVYQNLVSDYNTTYQQRSQYTLNQYSPNPRAFMNGDFDQGGFEAQSHLFDEANFSYSAKWLAQREMDARIAAAQYDVSENLRYGNGFFPGRECNDGQNSNVVPGIDCKTTTPAIVNQQTTQNRLLLGENRAANNSSQFNQVVQGLLQMVPVALGSLFNGR